jgi:ABC-type nitrate/sulfonate/bicarbonate transport system permease component
METRLMKGALGNVAARLWLPLTICLLWEIVARLSPNIFFPPPSEIGSAFLSVSPLGFWTNTLSPTLSVLVIGFVSGGFFGVLVGVFLGTHEPLRKVTYPIGVFVRSVPTAAKLPVILGIVGIGAEALYLAVFLAVFFNVLVVTMLGVARVHQKTLEAAQILGLGWWRTSFGVKLPAAMGDVLTGLQSALQVAILVTVLVETLASGFGIGSFLQDSSSLYRFSEMWVALITLGLIGIVGNETFHLIERRAVPWYFATRISK